jgi:hypothetical protein
MPNCLLFTFDTGECRVFAGAQLLDHYINVDEQCPNGVYPGSRMEHPGAGEKGAHPGLCTNGY